MALSRQVFLSYSLYDSVINEDMWNVNYLLKVMRANPNCIISDLGIAPMHYAAGIGSNFGCELVSLFLKFGGDPNIRSSDGMTPVMISALWDRSQILNIFLSNGGNPFIKDNEFKNSFDYAKENNSSLSLYLLMQYKMKFSTNDISNTNDIFSDIDSDITYVEVYVPNDSNSYSINTINEPMVKYHSDLFSNRNLSIQSLSDIDNSLRSYTEVFEPNTSWRHSTFINENNTSFRPQIRVPSYPNIYSEPSFIEPVVNFYNSGLRRSISDTSLNFSSNHISNIKSSSSTILETSINDGSTASSSSLDTVSTKSTGYVRQMLKTYEISHGPVLKSTKNVYLRHLKKIENGKVILEKKKNDFNELIESTFRANLKTLIKKWSILENEMVESFNNCKILKRLPQTKTFFTYLLLDPFVTQNLPNKKTLDDLNIWKFFLKSIFYVGKGKNSRPLSHLYEALKCIDVTESPKKIKKIHEIWSKSGGVVCLSVFHNIISWEAHTREAAMIDALSGGNLTNLQSGEYHGIVKNWSLKKKRQLGVVLLDRALRIYLAEGERQILPKDLK